ncbi:DnaJ / Sec63 Brl domains-containing protein [Striga asiatica]|uniref:DnaJ / Sec63 Brl domains-containing protein n=1 Tax=Striga asiatica TaxID=4170 RepID=A0A5A7QDM1_STRAF|nr:DnaJ / Sec63 Brl domains-containing protein [Striga asiatica]
MVPVINANAKTTPTIQFHHTFALSPLPKLHFFAPSALNLKALKISCRGEKEEIPADDALAAELNLEINKLNSSSAHREEAFRKSREILFAEVCKFTGVLSADLERKWRRMNEGERWAMAKGFVSVWGDRFHPLSARSVKDMMDEYLRKEDEPVSIDLLPGLKKLLGVFFSGNDEE